MSYRLSDRLVRERMAALGYRYITSLSEAAGLDRQTAYMALRRGSCSLRTLVALAEVLQCRPGDLLESSPGPGAV